MKKVVLAINIAFLGLASLVSCKKQKVDEPIFEEKSNITSSNFDIYAHIGQLHNLGLYSLLSTDDLVYNDDKTFDEIKKSVVSRTYDYLYKNSFLDFNSSDYSNNNNIFKQSYNEVLNNHPNDRWDILLSNVSSKISKKEMNYINSLKRLYSNSYKLKSAVEQSDYLISEISSLKKNFDNEIWEKNSGDLAGGMIAISLYSAKFWHPSNDNNPGQLRDEENLNIPMIIQADCIGYL